MKHLLLILIVLITTSTYGQPPTGEENVKKVVIDFFEAFHRQDSLALRHLTHSDILMQSVTTGPSGETKVITESFGKFLTSIVSIPSTTKFKEILHSFDVTLHGALATVVTPFSFYLNGNLSHCGVNSFTMVQESEAWKIVHLIDTRRKEGCAK